MEKKSTIKCHKVTKLLHLSPKIDAFLPTDVEFTRTEAYVNSACRRITFWSHIGCQAFGKSTCLTLIPSRHIYNAFASFFARILKISMDEKCGKTQSYGSTNSFARGNSPSNASLEKSTASVTRWYTVMLSRCTITANFAMGAGIVRLLHSSTFRFRHFLSNHVPMSTKFVVAPFRWLVIIGLLAICIKNESKLLYKLIVQLHRDWYANFLFHLSFA